MYVALTYVDTGKTVYMPGEVIEDDPNAEWHLKIGAIRPMAEEPEAVRTEKARNAEAPVSEEAPAESRVHRARDEDAGETIDEMEEPEAPEIDVTAALVQDPEEEPKPFGKKKGGRRK